MMRKLEVVEERVHLKINIFKVLSKLFNNVDKNEDNFYAFQIERDRQQDIQSQRVEDWKMELHIANESRRLFNEWVNAKTIIFNDEVGIKLFRNYIAIPRGCIYMIHNEETAKYKGVSICDLIMKRFKEYKEEFNKNAFED